MSTVGADRALLIDLDGVLRLWSPDNDRIAERVGGLPAGSVRPAAFAQDLLVPAITGRVSDEQWRQQVLTRLRAEFPAASTERAVETWSESSGTVDEAVLGLVRACRRMARVVLVTNATSRLAHDLERLGIDGEFDAVTNSSVVGVAKPNEDIYRAALASVGVAPAQAMFVDDSPVNVEAAVGLGMGGHVYRDAQALHAQLVHTGLIPPDVV